MQQSRHVHMQHANIKYVCGYVSAYVRVREQGASAMALQMSRMGCRKWDFMNKI